MARWSPCCFPPLQYVCQINRRFGAATTYLNGLPDSIIEGHDGSIIERCPGFGDIAPSDGGNNINTEGSESWFFAEEPSDKDADVGDEKRDGSRDDDRGRFLPPCYLPQRSGELPKGAGLPIRDEEGLSGDLRVFWVRVVESVRRQEVRPCRIFYVGPIEEIVATSELHSRTACDVDVHPLWDGEAIARTKSRDIGQT